METIVFFNLPFPCNCIQMSLTAEAIQNTTTIPRRAPTNYAAYERSFCKLRFFTLQSATTQKSRLHCQAPQQPRALLRALMPSRCRPRVLDGKCAVTLGAVPPQDAGMWQLRSGRTRSLHPSLPPSGLQHRAALPCRSPWSRAAGGSTRTWRPSGQVAHGILLRSLRGLLAAQKGSQKCSRDPTANLGCTEAKYQNGCLNHKSLHCDSTSSRVSINQQSRALSSAMKHNRLVLNVTWICAHLYSQTA